LATKFAAKINDDRTGIAIDGRPEYVRSACEASEVGPDLIRRADAVHPVTALQSEYSLWERSVDDGIIDVCRELGITLVPYSPLGRSALTGALKPDATFTAGDVRGTNPRFSGDHLRSNLKPVELLKALADEKGCTAGQLALAWLLAQPLNIAPIPGTKQAMYVRENVMATDVAISADEIANLADVFKPANIVGDRYGEAHQRTIAR
jgi:aryl-alcohol dehydrogenase-like predicted oxidoreductase